MSIENNVNKFLPILINSEVSYLGAVFRNDATNLFNYGNQIFTGDYLVTIRIPYGLPNKGRYQHIVCTVVNQLKSFIGDIFESQTEDDQGKITHDIQYCPVRTTVVQNTPWVFTTPIPDDGIVAMTTGRLQMVTCDKRFA
jgi:hypothetical protein